MNVVSYYRYSSDNKNQVDNSEARQQDAVERVIYSHGWHEVGSFTDHAVSGTDDKPQLEELKGLVQTGKLRVDIICIDSLSRISRRAVTEMAYDTGWIKDAGIKLSIADKNNGTPVPVSDIDDDLAMLLDAQQNNQYVKKLSRDVSNGMRVKFAKGTLGWMGKAPTGFDLVRSLDEPSYLKANSDLEIVKEIFERFLAGNGIRTCIDLIEETEKFRTGKGRNPNSQSVKNILRNSIYAGIRTFGVRSVGKHSSISTKHNLRYVKENPLVQAESYQEYKAPGFEPIVSVDEYNRVQAVLDNNQKKFKKHPARHKHPYSGLFRCAHCDTAMVATTWKNKKTDEVRINYVCPRSADGSSACKESEKPHRKHIRVDEFEPLLSHQFGVTLMSKEFHFNNLQLLVDRLMKRSKTAIAAVEEDFEIQNRRLTQLSELFTESNLDPAVLKSQLKDQIEKVNEAKRKREGALEEDQLIAFAREQHEKIDELGPLNGYFGFLYSAAVGVCGIDDSVQRLRQMELLAGAAASTLIDAVAEVAANIELVEGVEAGNKILNGFGVAGSAEDQVKILRAMGLDHIKVQFERGLFRGQPRQMPASLSLVFLVTSSNYTDKCVVLRSNQMELLSCKTSGIDTLVKKY